MYLLSKTILITFFVNPTWHVASQKGNETSFVQIYNENINAQRNDGCRDPTQN